MRYAGADYGLPSLYKRNSVTGDVAKLGGNIFATLTAIM